MSDIASSRSLGSIWKNIAMQLDTAYKGHVDMSTR